MARLGVVVGDLSVYLFDIPAKKVYSIYGTATRFDEGGLTVLTVLTRQVFAQFLKNRA